MTFENKTILVIGGTSGIGLAVASAVSNAGGRAVVVSSRRARVEAALARLGETAEGHVADLSRTDGIEALFGRVGPIDHLVFTAGDAVLQKPLADTHMDEARRFFDVRFWGAYAAAKYGHRSIRPGGSITLTSSTIPRRPTLGFAVGASVSYAVEGLARALAVELAPIRVNTVAPGITRTPIFDRLPEEQREAFFAARGAAMPTGRVSEASDVAEAYLYAMRGASTTGQTIVVDGGMLLV
jgi:NAD(P)-dependent dehydrogenase (short-subunit alcohol dehydrogenase family)